MPSREIQKIITAMSNEDVKFLGSQGAAAVWYKLINAQAFCLKNSVSRSELIKAVFPRGEYNEALRRFNNASPRRDANGDQSAEYLNAKKKVDSLNAKFGVYVNQIRKRAFPIFNAYLADTRASISEEKEYCFALCSESIQVVLDKCDRVTGKMASISKPLKALLKIV